MTAGTNGARDAARPAVGFIGLGDQGLPMAVAIADAGFPLHVWARTSGSLDELGAAPHVAHATTRELGEACDIVGLCVSHDEDVFEVVEGGLLDGLRRGTVIVNHGTGTPANARRLADRCARTGVDVLDAPVSGGRPGGEARTLTTLVGGPQGVLERCEPVFRAFSAHVVHLGEAGAGQTAKLFNNTLLMMNQASIAEVVAMAKPAGLDPRGLVEALKLGSATSSALTLLNTMVTPDTVDHLSKVEAEDMQIFRTAMADAGIDAEAVTERGLSGAKRLPDLIRQLNP